MLVLCTQCRVVKYPSNFLNVPSVQKNRKEVVWWIRLLTTINCVLFLRGENVGEVCAFSVHVFPWVQAQSQKTFLFGICLQKTLKTFFVPVTTNCHQRNLIRLLPVLVFCAVYNLHSSVFGSVTVVCAPLPNDVMSWSTFFCFAHVIPVCQQKSRMSYTNCCCGHFFKVNYFLVLCSPPK